MFKLIRAQKVYVCSACSSDPHPLATQVEYPDGTNTLCLLPAKFHKKIWIKCGNYLIIEDTPDADARVTGQIVSVLYYDHVKQLKRLGTIWPSEFDDVIEEDEPSCDIQGALEKLSIATKCSGSGEEDSESDDDELPPLQQIQNRRVIVYSEDSSEEEVEDTNQ